MARTTIQLISRNKRICLWHWRLAPISNAYIVEITKLVDGNHLEQKNKEYNFVEVVVDSDDSDTLVNLDERRLSIQVLVETSIVVLR